MNAINRNHETSRRPQCLTRLFPLALAVLMVSATPAVADYWFLGVGNEGYMDDVEGLFGALTQADNWQGGHVHSWLHEDRSGPQILNDMFWLTWYPAASDLAVFYYSGHGTQEFDWGLDETDWNDECIGMPGAMCTDDEIAAELDWLPSTVPLVAIFDTCYAGGMTGGLDDLNTLPNAFIMMSCREGETSDGGWPYSEFTGHLIDGITRSGDEYRADQWWHGGNGDGVVTLEEWFAYADRYTFGQSPRFCDTNGLGTLTIATPEPATVCLLGAGALSILLRRRRR